MEEIRFGGNTFPPFRKKEGIRNAFDVLEQAFLQLTSTEEGKERYGDPEKGATLEQAWRTAGIFTGKWPVCLLATGKPEVPTSAIEMLIKVNPQQMIEVFRGVYGMTDKAGIQVLYHDGKMGHSITLVGYDAAGSRFTYYDPWPDFSLLSKAYNRAGVDARRVDQQHWSLTEEELKRIVFAALIQRNIWATFTGEEFTIRLTDLQQTDFWRFFHLRIVEEQTEEDGTMHRIKTGGFQSEVDLSVKTNSKGEVKESTLCLNKSWLFATENGINPFGLDIIRSFVSATVSPADGNAGKKVAELFSLNSLMAYVGKFRNREADQSTGAEIMRVCFGMSETYDVPFPFTTFQFANRVDNDTTRFVISSIIDTIDEQPLYAKAAHQNR